MWLKLLHTALSEQFVVLFLRIRYVLWGRLDVICYDGWGDIVSLTAFDNMELLRWSSLLDCMYLSWYIKIIVTIIPNESRILMITKKLTEVSLLIYLFINIWYHVCTSTLTNSRYWTTNCATQNRVVVIRYNPTPLGTLYANDPIIIATK